MSDLVRAGNILGVSRLCLSSLLLLLAGCNSPAFAAFQAEQDKYASTSAATEPESTGGEVATGGASGADGADGAGDASGESVGESTGDVSDAGDAGETNDASGTGSAGDDTTDTDADSAGPPVGEADKPSIVAVTLPAKVYAAGPVPIEVQAESTKAVRVQLNGADIGELASAGGGLFVGALPVRGAIDEGSHDVEVIATQGPYEDRRSASFEVSTPEPGTMAWFKAGPAGSRTNRVALTPEGDTLEGGQVEVNKVQRPSLRKRSGVTGAEIWSVVLDTREGSVADLAVLPDGRVWLAMNVRKVGDPSPQPRIALFDADGEPTGVEALGDLGQGVRGIAADAEGGCFAGGYAPAGTDLDIAFWRVNAAGVQTLAKTWDYMPNQADPHTFWEFATDVVIKGNVAWVIGASNGYHVDDPDFKALRGVLMPVDLHTGKVIGVIVAPVSGAYNQSVFFGGGQHPDGVLVTGYACDKDCTSYRIETSLYTPTGQRPWHSWTSTGDSLRYGSDVVFDSQGRALVGGTISDKGLLRGYLFARVVGEKEPFPLFDHWFPTSNPSEVLAVIVDAYDRIFAAGYITANGSTQSRLSLIAG